MYSSIWNNYSIKVGKEPFVRAIWLNKAISRISDLYVDGLFQTFEELKQKFYLTDKADFWKYLQLRSRVTHLIMTQTSFLAI